MYESGEAETEAAVAAFLRGAPPPAPYEVDAVGAYRALCLRPGAGGPRQVVLLAGEDGAVYAPVPAESSPALPGLEDVLRRQRLRPTGTTLAVRLPAALTGAPSRPGRFILWASPAYRAAGGGGGGEGLWK